MAKFGRPALDGASSVLSMLDSGEALSAQIVQRRLLDGTPVSELTKPVSRETQQIAKKIADTLWKNRSDKAVVMPWVPAGEDFSVNLVDFTAAQQAPHRIGCQLGIRNGSATRNAWPEQSAYTRGRRDNGNYYVSGCTENDPSKLVVPVPRDEYGAAPVLMLDGVPKIDYEDMVDRNAKPLELNAAELKALEAAYWLGVIDVTSYPYQGVKQLLRPKPKDFPLLAHILEEQGLDQGYVQKFGTKQS